MSEEEDNKKDPDNFLIRESFFNGMFSAMEIVDSSIDKAISSNMSLVEFQDVIQTLIYNMKQDTLNKKIKMSYLFGVQKCGLQ